jgi:hypothetical protein
VGGETVWWDDIQQTVRETACQEAQEFAEKSISGTDLYISDQLSIEKQLSMFEDKSVEDEDEMDEEE